MWNNLLFGKANGTFIEMGALDGKGYSNSWFFEKSLGWRGLLIEPDPTMFPHILRNRPDAIALSGAICANVSIVHFWLHTQSHAMQGEWGTATATGSGPRGPLSGWMYVELGFDFHPCATMTHCRDF